jgi:hypothetical protein
MPTLQRFGAASVRIYADDHRPPHFHIVAPDFQVHRESLALKWAELNERG